MPQIWMTYDELGDLLDCSMEDARHFARALDRKKSRDGATRAKLDGSLTELFLARLMLPNHSIPRAPDHLREVWALMNQKSAVSRP